MISTLLILVKECMNINFRIRLNWKALVAAASLVFVASPSRADSFFSQFQDTQDGWLDASDFYLQDGSAW